MAPTDTQRAYHLIKDKIVKTELPPGAVIREAELMTQLSLGRTPIREALKLLEAECLVSVSPRRGIFVTSINLSDLAEIQDIRSALDVLCARLAAPRITPAEVGALRAIVSEGMKKMEDGDQAYLLELDQSFHRLLAQCTRSRLLQGEIETFYNLSMRIWYYYLNQTRPEDLALDSLAEVVDALEAGDSERAERAMQEHILHFGDAIKRCL